MFELKFETDNAAFGDNDQHERGYEIARILRKIADSFENAPRQGEDSEAIHDHNGNRVGELHFTFPWEGE